MTNNGELMLPIFENHTKCQSCIGHCCQMFHLPLSVDELKFNSHPDAKFALENFEFIPTPYARYGEYMYTCKKYDNTLGRCTVYDDRPELCKKYMCDQRDGFEAYKRSVAHGFDEYLKKEPQ